MRVPVSLLQHEFIGMDIKVVKSTNPNYVGITGRVINETRNTFVIRHGNNDKVVVKNTAVFHVALEDGTIIEVEGWALVGRPEDRLKKRTRRRW
ncbi:ribonuclease P protein subunit [Candidatus Bathyarchaeota archaeon]|nr:ribonuclease P protein subunit [Candidatus Bathyarchaeota archaeon]NIV44976.1 ribonuclease P protein subunit [Candidatus Bathyarchaeota archaeon]NIW11347.1 ribonuclease P protein subunit [Gammaproteobacteria bacterium]